LNGFVCGAFFILSLVVGQSGLSQDASKPTSASPELVDQLTQPLSITPAQATGGAGALFGLVKSRLSPADFSKVASAVRGMDRGEAFLLPSISSDHICPAEADG